MDYLLMKKWLLSIWALTSSLTTAVVQIPLTETNVYLTLGINYAKSFFAN